MAIHTEHSHFRRSSIARNPGLPPGVCQADCDGRMNRLADAEAGTLWNSCDEHQQEIVSSRFVQMNLERIRDALLDIEDGFSRRTDSSGDEAGETIGRLIWTRWVGYRDRTMWEMARRGELSSI